MQVQGIGTYIPEPKGDRFTLKDTDSHAIGGQTHQETMLLTLINRVNSASSVFVGNGTSQWIELAPGDTMDLRDMDVSQVYVTATATGAPYTTPAKDTYGNYAYVDYIMHGRRYVR